MRLVVTLFMLTLISGCTAMVLGGGQGGSYPAGAGSQTTTVTSSDAAITARIREQYAANTTVGAFNLGIRTHSGSVTLTGTVRSHVTREQAGRIAAATSGVKAVNNQITVSN